MKLTEEEKQKRLKRCFGKSLADTHPDIAIEWDYEANEDLTPQMVTKGCGNKAFWICNKGHSYPSIIQNRTKNGHDCPYCANNKILIGFNDLATTHPDIAAEWDYEKNKGLSNKKGEDCSLPTLVMAGTSAVKPFWLCKKHKHSWSASVATRISNGNNCPYCSNQKVLQGFNDLATTHPDILKIWDYERNVKLPTEIIHGTREKIWIKCSNGHSYQDSLFYCIKQGCKCKICNRKINRKTKIATGENDLATQFPEALKDWDYDNNTLNPYKISPGTTDIVSWKCHICGYQWKTSPYVRTNTKAIGKNITKCPKCNCSDGEKKILEILDNNNILYQFQKRILPDMNIIIDNKHSFDFFIDHNNYVIEYDGLQHFKPCFGKPTLNRTIRNDNTKNLFCIENNILILRIPYKYYELDTSKFESFIIGFIKNGIIPQEIIDFYTQYDFSNYAEIATKQNQKIEKE